MNFRAVTNACTRDAGQGDSEFNFTGREPMMLVVR